MTAMRPTLQPGIFAVGTRSHHHLHFDVDPEAPAPEVLGALQRIREHATTIAGVNVVVGLGSELCARIAPDRLPEGVGPFETLVGPDGCAIPGDQHDLWVWLHSAQPDAVFDVALATNRCLQGVATVAVERPCFTYQTSRDLTGFEDGTENPPLDEAIELVAVPPGRPGAGSSVVLVQHWVHDLEAFQALDDEEKDQVIGRHRLTGEAIPRDRRSPRAHISRVSIGDEDGEELRIFRRSVAYGGVLEHGLEFVAFSPDVARLDAMLRRMVGIGDGVRDRLTDISTCRASAWYVAPPVEAFVPG
jgi:putative iron-dependent peroxidase